MAASLASLLQKSSLNDHEGYLRSANETLKGNRTDVYAQYVRLVALLKLDRYDDALRAVEDSQNALVGVAPFEVAYTYYKNGKLSEAKQLLARRNGESTALMHVEAQTAYRSEDFEKSVQLYAQLAAISKISDETSDLRINAGATDAQLAWSERTHLVKNAKASRDDLEHFETTFNAACIAIARGELKQAEILLNRARDLCNASNELSDEEKRLELLPIQVQQIYILSVLGKADAAETLGNDLDISSITDKDTRHIAQSNALLAITNSSNPYLSHRLFQSTSELPLKYRPFNYQSSILRQNAWTLDLLISKRDGVSASTTKFIDTPSLHGTPKDIAQAGVLNAAAHSGSATGKAALKEILHLLEQRPRDIGLLLTIVHLYLLTNNTPMATHLVEDFVQRLEKIGDETAESLRYTPGLVALLVSLYAQQNRNSHTKAELARAATYWRHKSKDYGAGASLLKYGGAALVDDSTDEERQRARELFEYINEREGSDKIGVAGLVASCSEEAESLAQAKQLSTQLPVLDKLLSGIDVASLEDGGVARIAAGAEALPSESKKRAAERQPGGPQKSKKVRKNRLPASYDPNKQPDPERWLPLRDRSTWRPKGKKKGRAAGGMSTQGGIVSEDSRPATPSTVQTVSQQPGKNKKKKGKK